MNAYVSALLHNSLVERGLKKGEVLPEEEVQRLLEEATKYHKRWSEGSNVGEVSFIRLTRDGSVLKSQHFSAGLNVWLHGMTTVDGEPIAYGSLGGIPAITSH
jgi:hypothetical protein